MKILHVTPAYYPATYWGGPIFSVYHLNNALAQIPGIEIKVLTTDSAGHKLTDRLNPFVLDKTLYPNQAVIFTRRIARASVSLDLLKRLPALVRWADVVHLTATYSFPTIPVLGLCRFQKKTLVWSLRGALLDDQIRSEYDPQSRLKKMLKAVWIDICRKTMPEQQTVFHVTSQQERTAVEQVFPDIKYAVIPNGVIVPKSSPRRKQWMPNGVLRLMFIGRLVPKKGIENLLQAMANVDVPVTLDIYGSPTVGQGGNEYKQHLIDLAKKLEILDRSVHFRGHVDGEVKKQAFVEADVCVIPSYSENFGIVVAEALAMGIPVIVSSCLPQWKDVVKRNCGIWVDNDPVSLAQAICRIRDMNLSDMGKNGWIWMKEEFGWTSIAQKMHHLYQSMYKGGKANDD